MKNTLEICRCPCHESRLGTMVHAFPCCLQCPHCKENIIDSMYGTHTQNCNPKFRITPLSVQQLIDQLNKVKDKSLPVYVWMENCERLPITIVDEKISGRIDLNVSY